MIQLVINYCHLSSRLSNDFIFTAITLLIINLDIAIIRYSQSPVVGLSLSYSFDMTREQPQPVFRVFQLYQESRRESNKALRIAVR